MCFWVGSREMWGGSWVWIALVGWFILVEGAVQMEPAHGAEQVLVLERAPLLSRLISLSFLCPSCPPSAHCSRSVVYLPNTGNTLLGINPGQ